eukprot:COSAG02_NODE_61132_length_269_cov_0.900000_1_plen_39_part_10
MIDQIVVNNDNGGANPEIFMQIRSSGADVVEWRFPSLYG